MSLLPSLPLPPMAGSLPPTTAEGSMPHSISIWVSSAVVVVLPWVPQTQMQLSNQLVTSPSRSARSMVGTPLARAAISSGLSSMMAAVWTIRSAPSMFSARWPMVTGMPSFSRSKSMVSPGLLSEPVM